MLQKVDRNPHTLPGLLLVRATSLLVVFLSFFGLLCGQVVAEELRLRIETKDGKPAEVSVEGNVIGRTGETLTFDISNYPKPVFLDVVLSRPEYLPTLHSLEVEAVDGVWQPEPLGLCKQVNPVALVTKPPDVRLFREKRDGSLVPVGQNSQLLLTVDRLPPGQPFVPQSVILVLEKPGYQKQRIVAPASIWTVDSFPPQGEMPIILEPSYGLGAWWIRTGSQNIGMLLGVGLIIFLILGMIRLRYHYLKTIEANHKDLQVWVERLDTFVEGSRELATPLKMESLTSKAAIQARRLTRSEWEWVEFIRPNYRHLETALSEQGVEAITHHLSQHPDRPLHLDVVNGTSFSELRSAATSILAQPLKLKDEYRGFVLVASTEASAFSETDRQALGVLANQLAAAVERLRLHAETVEAYHKLAESEAQLIESAKMAAVGQLAAGVAHELNSPLNAINLGIQMAQRNLSKNPTIAEKRLNLAGTATKKASDIVSKLLYYSREGLQESQEIAIESLWDDALGLMNLQLTQDEISVSRGPRVKTIIVGNQTELTQVLTSLLMNARDAILKSPDAPREISICSNLTDRGLELSVSDQGQGVSDEIRSRIFEPFFSTKNLGGEGTGLSLSVGRKIAERHCGELLLDSSGQPTIFTLVLPQPATNSEEER